MKLSRAVSEVLGRAGVAPEQFELLPRERGWDAEVGAEVAVGPLVAEVLRELPALVRRFNGLGLIVAVDVRPPSALPGPTDHATVVIPRALRDTVADPRFQPFPGTDTWFCQLPAAPGTSPLAVTLAAASAVVLGFDGTLTRLYTPGRARETTLRLLAFVGERRDPEEASSGRPIEGTSEFTHPLDVLRAFADEGAVTGAMHAELAQSERQAVRDAVPVPHSATLVETLRGRDYRVAVVSDVSARTVTAYVAVQGLGIPPEGLLGRGPDTPQLLPDPVCLRRALWRLDVPPERCVMVGATVPEAMAAWATGIPFIGLARDDRTREALLAAGARHTVASLAEVVDALRAG
ncbi:HAD family hydrolase [Streptomyces sp. G45]|uniref:HAD family hydrolase n=1 Tax=Streptomyces sp. G45 TaxID=3406627 RepID=UPI003C283D8A